MFSDSFKRSCNDYNATYPECSGFPDALANDAQTRFQRPAPCWSDQRNFANTLNGFLGNWLLVIDCLRSPLQVELVIPTS